MEAPSCGWQSGASPPGTWAFSGSPTAAESGSQASRPIAGTAPRAAGCGLPGTTAGPSPSRWPRRGARSAPRSMCVPGSCSERVMTFQLRERVPLAPYTTLGLGGPARYFHECATEAELREALTWARERRLRVQIIGGGSNLVVADAGFPGLVLKVAIGGVALRETAHDVELTAGAGVEWDALVRQTVERGWTGIECLSGIPGTVGATPIQNVGAYGQEIADTVVSVTCLERDRLTEVVFSREQCEF